MKYFWPAHIAVFAVCCIDIGIPLPGYDNTSFYPLPHVPAWMVLLVIIKQFVRAVVVVSMVRMAWSTNTGSKAILYVMVALYCITLLDMLHSPVFGHSIYLADILFEYIVGLPWPISNSELITVLKDYWMTAWLLS